jgi:hypothetical protein
MAAAALGISFLSLLLAAIMAYLQLLRGSKLSVIIGRRVYLAWGVQGRDGLEITTDLTVTNSGARDVSLTYLAITLIGRESPDRIVLPWRDFRNFDGRNWMFLKNADLLSAPARSSNTYTVMFVSQPSLVQPGSYNIEISTGKNGDQKKVVKQTPQRILRLSDEVMTSLNYRDENTGWVQQRTPVIID